MKNLLYLALVMAVFCGGCMHVSPAERALWELRSSRETIAQVNADRASAGELAPVQHRICATLTSFDEVAACECAIRSETENMEAINKDGSLACKEQQHLRVMVLVTMKVQDVWNAERARKEIADLLRDNGMKNFTVELPVQSGLTWVVAGTSAAQ